MSLQRGFVCPWLGPAQEARKSGVRDTDETQPLEDENATPEIAAFDLTMPVDNETQPYSAEQGGLPKVGCQW